MIKAFKELVKPVNSHKSYQLYEKISFEETDDASNYSLKKLPQSFLYETNRLSTNPSKRMFFIKNKDYSAGSEGITIPVITKKELVDNTHKNEYGYYHIAALQMLVKFLGNSGIDIPIKIAVRDQRIRDCKKSIIGLWSSNLYTGAVYTVLYLDYTISAADSNIDKMLTLYVKPTIDMEDGSFPISISTKVYMSWIATPTPHRKRDEEFSRNRLEKGQSVIIKSKDTDISVIPQPIPIEKLKLDLDFDFPKSDKVLHVGSTSEVDYYHDGNESFRVTLKEPVRTTKGNSRGKNQKRFNDDLEEVDSE